MTADDFKKLMELYKKQNPAKYEAKKEALEAKLASLQGGEPEAPAKKAGAKKK